MQNETQNKITKLQTQLVIGAANTGLELQAHQIQSQAEAQYEQDMATRDFIEDRFSTPQKTGNTLVLVGSGITLGYN